MRNISAHPEGNLSRIICKSSPLRKKSRKLILCYSQEIRAYLECGAFLQTLYYSVNWFRFQCDHRINLSSGLMVWDQKKIPWSKVRSQFKLILYGQFCSKDVAVLTLKSQAFSRNKFQCIISFPTNLKIKGLKHCIVCFDAHLKKCQQAFLSALPCPQSG